MWHCLTHAGLSSNDMEKIIILILCWSTVFIVAFVILPVWRRYFYTGRHLSDYSLHTNTQVAVEALRQLNCKPKTQIEHNDRIIEYDYQGRHFKLRIEEGQPYVQLSYLFLLSASSEQLQQVRQACNQCNLNSGNIRLVYTANTEKNTIDVHAFSTFLLPAAIASEQLSFEMTNAFRWQNTLNKYMQELTGPHDDTADPDPEHTAITVERQLFLLREQELAHQHAAKPMRGTQQHPLTLQTVLDTVFGLHQFTPISLTICTDTVTQTDDTDTIRHFRLDRTIIDGEGIEAAFRPYDAMLRLSYIDPTVTEQPQQLCIDVTSQQRSDTSLYYRITLTPILQSQQPEEPHHYQTAHTRPISILAAYDTVSPEQKLKELRYMWEEAQSLQRTGHTEELSAEQKLMLAATDEITGHRLYEGQRLFMARRYQEAIGPLLQAFEALQPTFENMKPENREQFYELCYLLGFCHHELGAYAKAYYYLDIIFPLRRIAFTEEYINVLVNNGDFRALSIINTLLMSLADSSVQQQSTLHSFINFLRRRKAYVLIDRQQYAEAKLLLKQLLEEPESSDYALRELAYLQNNTPLTAQH